MDYGKASGQVINFEKSAASLSPNCDDRVAGRLQQILNVKVVKEHAVYLGLPTFSMRHKRVQFGYIRDRIQNKLLMWKDKMFSAGGKEVLLKAVIQAIPTYTMSCFRLPESVCCDIDRACAGFWWGDGDDQRRLHWKTWDAMCKPKEFGGLGFRNIRSFNRALLAKQLWRFLNNPTALVTKVFKARYFRKCDLLQATIPSNASFVWRSIFGTKDLIEEGMVWRVGDGSKIRIFHDRWTSNLPGNSIRERATTATEKLFVSNLINQDSTWDRELIDAVFYTFERDAILSTPIGEAGLVDSLKWRFEAKGNFTVKSAYLLSIGYFNAHPYQSDTNRKFWSRLVWARSIPPKVRIFAWRALNNVIPTDYNLMLHHVPGQGICSMCQNQIATIEHSLLWCDKVRIFSKNSSFWKVMKQGRGLALADLAMAMENEFESDDYDVWLVVLWLVWQFICRTLHNNEDSVKNVLEVDGRMYWKAYQEARLSFTNGGVLGVVLGSKRWQKPRQGRVRVDVDALFDPNRGRFGVGVIARDHNGTILLAVAKRISPSSSSVMAELMVVIHGIIACIDYQLSPVEIFSDSIIVVRLLSTPDEYQELLPVEFCDIFERAREDTLLSVTHAYRSATRAAHHLACFSASISSSSVWTHDFPDWLRDIVLLDSG